MKVSELLKLMTCEDYEICWTDENGLYDCKPSWSLEPNEFDDATVTGITTRCEFDDEIIAVLVIDVE